MKHCIQVILWLACCNLLLSCSYSKKFTNTYYQENKAQFQSLQQRFKQLYNQQPFSAAIKDKQFNTVSIEINTDSIRYIYDFMIDSQALKDTLQKYRFNVDATMQLIHDMQKLNCTWLTNLDYYDRLQQKYLVFVSVRHRRLEPTLRRDKYFTLAFFNTPQPFDEKGRMLDNRDRKQLRKINGAVMFKLDERTGYALTATFR